MRVVIVGTGIAGLSCAISAASRGAEVVVVDKRRRIGEPIRSTGGIAKHFLLECGIPLVDDFMYALNRAYIMSPGAQYIMTVDGQAFGYVVDQGGFEEYLAREAERAGAEIRLEERVTVDAVGELRRRYDFVVGADGAYSTVRRYLGIPDNNGWDMHRALELWVRGEPRLALDNAFLIYFDKDAAPYGYIWLFRYKDVVKYGIGVPVALRADISKTLAENFDRFFAEGRIVHRIGGIVPTPPPLPRVVFGNVALVGDAGNFVNAATGGGIQGALLSGKYCGEAIGRGSLGEYERWYEGSARPLFRTWYRIKKFIYRLGNEDFDRLLRAFRGFSVRSMDPRKEISRLVRHVAFRDARLFARLVLAWLSA